MKPRTALAGWLSLPLALAGAPADPTLPPAFGPHVQLRPSDFDGARSFGARERIVGTYYFYWYNAETGEHLRDGDGSDALTTHPASLDDFSYASDRWHRQQLADMIDAGIDVLLPVFWGAPSEQPSASRLHWSYAGLPPLVRAREALLREGKQPPRIGLFYDTSTLQHNAWGRHVDLATDFGRRWFYATIRDFFSLIPPRHWAMIDHKPIVLLYSASFAKNHDASCIAHAKTEFAREFGGREPWIAAEVSWRVRADSKVAWGGALGLKNPGVASLGPGYDHSAVPGRAPLVVDRRDGRFYEEQWLKFLRRPSPFVMVETWNEFHEGTDIAHSREHGRRYIELTRKYADRFKQGWKPPRPAGPFTHASQVSILLGHPNESRGLTQIDNDDGRTEPVITAGRAARAMARNPLGGHYIYFAVDDSFKPDEPIDARLRVDYFDAAPGTLAVEYDGSDPDAPFDGAYTRSPDTVTLTASRTWKTAMFRLDKARLLNSQNRGSDFRLVLQTAAFAVGKLTLEKP
ncbi:MAG: DUF5010 domain-containing protein [Verrucomicrobia bacterium]|nr:DUF5010 domain-containing protein [Verrucomicrobiota bacterium]